MFTDPCALMENIENVTAFLREKIKGEGGNPKCETLTVVKTSNGENCYRLDDNNYFRVYYFIDNTKSIEDDKTLDDLYEAGKGFGKLQQMLADFPVEMLHETIKDLHNTPKLVDEIETMEDELKAIVRNLVK